MDSSQEQHCIVFKYEKHADYKLIYSNGAHGGITTKGEYKFDLFVEYAKAPEEIHHSITGDGLGPEVAREPPEPTAITREAQVGVIMNIESAKSLAHWILQNVRSHEEKSED